jgi:hypothetical protein
VPTFLAAGTSLFTRESFFVIPLQQLESNGTRFLVNHKHLDQNLKADEMKFVEFQKRKRCFFLLKMMICIPDLSDPDSSAFRF